jgi:TrmH family RNA methyltransferase
VLELTSSANPRVKQLVELRKRRGRERLRRTVIEGHDELRLAVEAGVRPHSLYLCDELIRTPDPDLIERATTAGAELVSVGAKVFDKIAYRESPDGWLAVVATPGVALAALALPPDPLLLICEGVEKPGNLGAMLRTADAAGADAVIAADGGTDWGNPNVVRASKGTIFTVPVASAQSDEVLDWLAAKGVQLYAATPHTDCLLPSADLTGPVAIAVGAERDGLTDRWLAAQRVKIPMYGRVNSLNVAASAAIILYEAVRQRAARITSAPRAIVREN